MENSKKSAKHAGHVQVNSAVSLASMALTALQEIKAGFMSADCEQS